jgi:hypothetical protein
MLPRGLEPWRPRKAQMGTTTSNQPWESYQWLLSQAYMLELTFCPNGGGPGRRGRESRGEDMPRERRITSLDPKRKPFKQH